MILSDSKKYLALKVCTFDCNKMSDQNSLYLDPRVISPIQDKRVSVPRLLCNQILIQASQESE